MKSLNKAGDIVGVIIIIKLLWAIIPFITTTIALAIYENRYY